MQPAEKMRLASRRVSAVPPKSLLCSTNSPAFSGGGAAVRALVADVEWRIHRAKSIPAPTDYTPNDPSRDLGTGFAVRFSSFHPKN